MRNMFDIDTLPLTVYLYGVVAKGKNVNFPLSTAGSRIAQGCVAKKYTFDGRIVEYMGDTDAVPA